MKLRALFMAALAFSLFSASAFSRSPMKKVMAVMGVLELVQNDNLGMKEFRLNVQKGPEKVVYRLSIPEHIRGVAHMSENKMVEVRGHLEAPRENDPEKLSVIKVLNLVKKRPPVLR